MQRLGDGAAAEHEAGYAYAMPTGVARDLVANSHDIFHRFYRGGQSEIARQLHLTGVLVNVTELTLLARAPVLAIAKDRNEGAEGHDLMIGRPVRQTLGIVVRGFREADFCEYAPFRGHDEPAVDHIDQVGRMRGERSLNRHGAHPVGPIK